MAYGNWGGKVWVDGEARHNNCDATVQQLFSGEQYTHYLEHYVTKHYEEGLRNPLLRMYHALAGDPESGIVVALYKSYLGGVFKIEDGKIERVEINLDGDDEMFAVAGIEVSVCIGYNSIDVDFVDPSGRKWSAVSGYGIGEGYEEWA
jgi:hypothetical protein